MRYVTVVAEFIKEQDGLIHVYNMNMDPIELRDCDVADLGGEPPEEGEEFIFQVDIDLAIQNGLRWE